MQKWHLYIPAQLYRLVDKLSNNMLRQWLKYYARGILTIKKLMNILKQNFDGICQKAILRRSCTFHIPILTEIYYLAYFYRVPFFLARLAQSASILVTYLIQDERMLILKTIRRLDIENFRVGRAWSMFLFPSSWFPIRIRNKKPVPYSLYMYFIQTSFQAVWHSGHFLTDFGRVSNSLDLDQTTYSPTSDDIKALWNWSRKEV